MSQDELWAPDYGVLPACWQGFDRAWPERIGLVCGDMLPPAGAPVAALRYEVRPGDRAAVGGNRAEASARKPPKPTLAGIATVTADAWPDPVGSSREYGWSVYVPEDFELTTGLTKWFILTQWKGLAGGRPPIALEIKRGDFRLGGSRLDAFDTRLGPVAKGVWTRFTVRIGWSTGPGWVQVERDGDLLVDLSGVATMDTTSDGRPDPTYLKQGIYRSTAWTTPHWLLQGPVTITDLPTDDTA